MDEFPALDKQHRPPKPREVVSGRRAASPGPDDDRIPDAIFGMLRNKFQRGRLRHVLRAPLEARPAFSYSASKTRAVSTASSDGSFEPFAPNAFCKRLELALVCRWLGEPLANLIALFLKDKTFAAPFDLPFLACRHDAAAR